MGETESTIRDTIEFAKKIDPDLVMFTLATPYPQTPLYAQARERGIISGDYWKDFTLGAATARLPYLANGADRWVRKAYRTIYFNPRFIIKRLRLIHSIDQLRKAFLAFIGLLFFRISEAIGGGKGGSGQ